MEKVYKVTEQLFQLLSKPVEKEQREDFIEEITSLLQDRDLLLPSVKPPFSDQDKQLFQQIAVWDKGIQQNFTKMKQQIQQDIIQLKKTESSNQQYVNPYQTAIADGMFYDKRK